MLTPGPVRARGTPKLQDASLRGRGWNGLSRGSTGRVALFPRLREPWVMGMASPMMSGETSEEGLWIL